MKIRTVLVDLIPSYDLIIRNYITTLYNEFDGDNIILSEIVINDGLEENDFSILVDVSFDDYFNLGMVVREIMLTSFFSVFADENNVIKISDLIEYNLLLTKNNNVCINHELVNSFRKSLRIFLDGFLTSLRYSNE